ncbi:phage tail length tape measure family protein [Shimia sagamensis]|uniref:Phage-related minor tail protein n=1 Tax=Shimia sagamensis TaxID=1566352 RepID=A0ABY1PDN5_9RHOB|nr:phage tail length tape measure family protein [Shimia sagamensis]SMP32195.1 Phage-related minor tail protein [Shimia sagamensis]
MSIEIGAVRASAHFDTASFVTGAKNGISAMSSFKAGFKSTTREAVRDAERMAAACGASFKSTSSAAQKQVDALAGVDRANKKTSASTRAWVGALNKQAQAFDRVRASVDPVFAASKQYEAAVDDVKASVRSGIASQSEANRVIDQAAQKYLGLVPVSEQAARAQEKAAKAAQTARSTYEQSRASLDPLYAASKRYEAVLRQTKAALASKAISQAEANQLLALAESQYLGTGAAAMQYGKQTKVATHHTANLAFQFNDIGMMMAAGQNPFMLAMQQGTQVSQVLNQMGGGVKSIRGIGAAFLQVINPTSLATLGIIAGAAALGQWAMSAWQAEDNAEAVKKRIEELQDAISSLSSISQASAADLEVYLAEAFGRTSEKVQALIDDLKEAEFATISRQMRVFVEDGTEGLNELSGAWDVFQTSLVNGAAIDQGYLNERMAVIHASKLSLSEFLQLQKEYQDVLNATSADQLVSEISEARDLAVQLGGPVGNAVADRLLKAAEEGGLLNRVLGAAAGQSDRIASSAHDAASGFLQAANNAMAMQQAMASLSVPFSDAMSDLDFEVATAGMNAADKLVATRVRRLEETMHSASETAFGFDYGLTSEQKAQLADYETALRGNAAALTTVSKAGGKASKASKDALSDLQAELLHRRKLLELQGAQKQQFEALTKVQERLGKSASKMTSTQVAGLAGQLVALENHEAALERINGLQGQWSEQITRTAFESGNMGDVIEGMLKDIAFQFASAKIVLPVIASISSVIGLDRLIMGGAGASVAGGAATGGGGAGLFGSLLGGSGLLSGIGGGFQAAMGLGGFASGGLFNIGANAAAASAITGASGFLSMVGAAIPVLGIAAVAISALIGKTKVLNSGLRITVDEFDALIESFATKKKTRLFGLIKKTWTDASELDAKDAAPIIRAIADVQGNIVEMAASLDVGKDAFKRFKTTVDVSLQGLSDEEKAKAIQDALQGIGDEMALLVPKLERFQKDGESASSTLQRLSASLSAVQLVGDTLGRAYTHTGVNAAAMASDIVETFGGLEAYFSATTAYHSAFYTDAEKLDTLARQSADALEAVGLALPKTRAEYRKMVEAANFSKASGREAYAALISLSGALDQLVPSLESATAQMHKLISGSAVDTETVNSFGGMDAWRSATEAFYNGFFSDTERFHILSRQTQRAVADLGLAMPETREEFRAMVAAIDVTTEKGREMYAGMISLAGAMDQILPTMEDVSAVVSGFMGGTSSLVSTMISETNSLISASQRAAEGWYGVADNLRSLIVQLTNASTSTASPWEKLATNQALVEKLFLQARGGDVDAARGFGGAAKDYLQSALATAGSFADYQRIEAQIRAQAQMLAGISELEGASQDVIVTLAQQQLGVLNSLNNYLQSTDEISPDDLDGFIGTLEGLEEAIKQAEMFSYDFLQERLNVTVDLIATADVPNAVRALMEAGTDGIHSTINFAVMDDELTPDLRWLAVTQASEHLSTINFALGDELTGWPRRLALMSSGSITRTVNAVLRHGLSHEEMRLALAGSSELARVVNVSLGETDPYALHLALSNVGAYAVAVKAALDASPDIRKIVFGGAGSYAVMVEAALSSDIHEASRRILLQEQGVYAVNITATLAQNVPDQVKALLLNANTEGLHAVTVGWTFKDKLTWKERLALIEDGRSILQTINLATNQVGIDAADLVMLEQLSIGDGTVNRFIHTALQGTLGFGAFELNYLAQLYAGAGTTWRGIKAGVHGGQNIGTFGHRYLNQLASGPGLIWRGVKASVSGVPTGKGANGQYLSQLFDGAGSVQRAIKGGVVSVPAGNGINGQYLRLLTKGEAQTVRNVKAGIRGVPTGKGAGAAYLAQLVRGDGQTDRSIKAAVVGSSGVHKWGQNYLGQLFVGSGVVARKLKAGVTGSGAIGKFGWNYLSQLNAGAGTTLRTVSAGVTGGGALGKWQSSYLSQLYQGAGSTRRAVLAAVDGKGVGAWGKNFLEVLFEGGADVPGTLNGKVNLSALTGRGSRFFELLTEKASVIQHTIDGVVDLGGLSKRQRALLDIVSGASKGTVTLGGNVKFDPSKGFSTWFGKTVRTGISTPVSELAESIKNLKEAMSRQRVDDILSQTTTNKRGMTFLNEAQIRALANAMGIDQTGVGLGDLMWQIQTNDMNDALHRVYYDPTGAARDRFETGVSVDHGQKYQFSDFGVEQLDGKHHKTVVTGPKGGKRGPMHYDAAMKMIDQIIFGRIPAFADGGFHSGGWAMVGERGPELAYMPPARVYNAPDSRAMMDNGDLVQELRALKQELSDTQGQSRDLLKLVVKTTERMRKLHTKWDATHLPVQEQSA